MHCVHRVRHTIRLLPSVVTAGATSFRAPCLSTMASLPAHHISRTSPWPWAPRFDNPWDTWTGDKKLSDVRKFMRQMRELGVPDYGYLSNNRKPSLEDFSKAFPLNQLDTDALAHPPTDAVQAAWVGHACVLVQMEGVTFITDPVLSERCSPVQFLGPRRVVAAPYAPESDRMPKLDFVLISHNHYDHLDTTSVKRIHRRFGDHVTWYVPLGLKAWFQAEGITNVIELDWWQEVAHHGSRVKIVMTPAQHWSARGILDRRQTLWGGYAVIGQHQRVWFAGDTGYCPVFQEIGERLGPFDLSAIPIGAYEPRDFMKPQHTNPEDAIQIHKDVKSQRSIGIHCCTFFLTLEPLDEPPRRLAAGLATLGMDPQEFVTLQHGALIQTVNGVTLNQPLLLGGSVQQAPPAEGSASAQGSA
eukprot:jgi/Chrzof1/2210/Cz11g06150.t1